jgi:hypothetical protein
MSLITTVYVREGIVMASDSRLSINTQQENPESRQIINVGVGLSDSNYKTFLALGRIGLSTAGQADINGVPLAGYIETFISQQEEGIQVEAFARNLLNYFNKFNPIPKTYFHVAGYLHTGETYRQKVYDVNISEKRITLLNPENNNNESQGAGWLGETDVLLRLLKPVYTKTPDGVYHEIVSQGIPFQFFTLQDAIDFSVYAIRTTMIP